MSRNRRYIPIADMVPKALLFRPFKNLAQTLAVRLSRYKIPQWFATKNVAMDTFCISYFRKTVYRIDVGVTSPNDLFN